MPRLHKWRRISPDGCAMLAILAAVLVANLPYLLDFSDPNPLGPKSGLVASFVPGPAGGQTVLDPNNGYISQAVSHRAMLDVVHLHMPWWDPFEGTGAPLAGGMQPAAFFAPTLLTLLSNGQLYEHVLLELVAGISTFLLLRRLGVGRISGTAGAVAFALNGTLAWFGHAPANPVAFLPLLLLGVEHAHAAATAGRRGGWWLMALAGALSVYAGFPETAYINALMAAVWLVWRCVGAGRIAARALVLKAAAAGLTGTLLAAPLVISMLDYFNHAELGQHTGTAYATGHIPAQGLTQLLLPYVFGPIGRYSDPKFTLGAIWVTVGGFLSTSLLLFAVLGLRSRVRRGLALTLLGWALLALSRMYGFPPVIDKVFGLFPGMNHVAFFRYATSSVEFAVIVLAAIGLDELRAAAQPRRRMIWLTAGLLGLLAVAVLAVLPMVNRLGSTFGHRPYFPGSVVWGCVVLIAGAVIATLRDRPRVWLGAGLICLDALLLFAGAEASAPRAISLDLKPVSYLQRNLGFSRAFTLGPLQPNYGSYFGVSLLNLNNLPIPKPFAHYVHARLDRVVDPTVFVGTLNGGRSVFAPSPQQELIRNLSGYRAAAVKYVLTPRGQRLPSGPFQLVDVTPTTWIYQLRGSQPYFSTSGAGCRTEPSSRTDVRVSCPAATQLIRRETDFPGWRVKVDGHAAAVHQVDGLFQGVSLSAGSHRVSYSYSPPNVGWGWLAFAGGLLLIGLGPRAGALSRFASGRGRASGAPSH